MSDFRAKCTISFVDWGFAPDPAGGAFYSAPPDPCLDFRGPTLKGGEGRVGKGRRRGDFLLSPSPIHYILHGGP